MLTLDQALRRINNKDLREAARHAVEQQGYRYAGDRKHGCWFLSADGVNTISVPWTTSNRFSIVKTKQQFERWAAHSNGKVVDPSIVQGQIDQARRLKVVEALIGAGPLTGFEIATRMGVAYDEAMRGVLRRMADGNLILRWGTQAGRVGKPRQIYAPLGWKTAVEVMAEKAEETKEMPLLIHAAPHSRDLGETRKDQVLRLLRRDFADKQFAASDLDPLIGANTNPALSVLCQDGLIYKSGRTGPSEGHSRGFQKWSLVKPEMKDQEMNFPPIHEEPVNPSPIPLPDPEDLSDLPLTGGLAQGPRESAVLPNFLGYPPSFWENVFMGLASAFAEVQRGD